MLPSRFFRRLISEQRRFKSSILDWQLKSIVNTNDTLELTVKDEKSSSRSLLIPFAWLRDHCNTHNYHAATNQRKNSMLNISIEAQIENASTSSLQDDVLSIRWKDGKISKFSIDDILSNSLNQDAQSSIGRKNSLVESWDNSTLKEIPQMRQSSVSLNAFCLNFLRYGLVIVNEVEATAQKTEELCKSILAIQDTFFGEFWVFSNESKDNEEEEYHEDTAYGNEEIGPHVDGTYFQNGLGIQVFHCLHPANKGGETVLIDGYKGAEILKEQYPDDYDILTKYKIDHQYIENGGNVQLHAVSSGNPVIQLDQHGNIAQIRNPLTDVQNGAGGGDDGAAAFKCALFVVECKTCCCVTLSRDFLRKDSFCRKEPALSRSDCRFEPGLFNC
ncbi:hypothetical protein WR25_05996 [Diploscapter pachys]|uniref:TauD/TfdA-like domain-containing protein n=1 Tax=Diploscapter pachys TaxID=2018661 RepID=A0A2A2LQV7_9BILA|nr:hypothetical protein WR25_05996 [Diploscapter pachys]